MENSPTGQTPVNPASPVEPTGDGQVVQPAEQIQDTSSGANTQGSVSDDTANKPQTQTQQTGGDSTTDDGLAKFAKSQGVEDVSTLSDNELRFLKIAHDNQKAFRQGSQSQEGVSDVAKTLGGTDTNARIAALEYERTTDRFWSSDGRDKSLEPTMTKILYDKVAELTPTLGEAEARKYAFNLSRDLGTLYGMAQLQKGAVQAGTPVDAEAIRREERESIRQAQAASAGNAHATSSAPSGGGTEITQDWIRNEYDPNNAEHRKMVDAYYATH